MRILITGGCGYIGYSILEYLLYYQELSEVVLYDNLQRKNPNFFLGYNFPNKEKISFVHRDILDNHSLEKALEDIDIVIHAAAKVSTPFATHNANEFDQVNNWGTSFLINAIEKNNSVKKVFYLSSISVYGNTKGESVDENSITSPQTFYGISKLNGEKHLKRISNKIETYIYRIGNVFGYNPSIRLNSVVNKFMFDAQFKNKIEVHGSGQQKRAFMSSDSIGKHIAKSCFTDDKNGGVYNLVEYNLSINEIVNYVKELYPNLETLHLDQHLEMRSITSNSIHQLDFSLQSEQITFHLQKMKHQFSF